MLTPCHGREAVQEAIAAALERSRWVSIIGPPGSGKSLVARHVAETAKEWVWVDARHQRDHDSVLRRVSRALGVEAAPGDSPAGALTRAVDGRDLLLVLDGLDPDAAHGAAWETLLDTTTDVRLLVTAV
ncbi:MAG: AAA family ATPase, partial [Nocardioides sp.]|nr:AAA family ATPase [Nocardioides sp.]